MDPIAMLFDEPPRRRPEMINEVLDVMVDPAKRA
jgi:ABC-type histidine transport system ATPase subunit